MQVWPASNSSINKSRSHAIVKSNLITMGRMVTSLLVTSLLVTMVELSRSPPPLFSCHPLVQLRKHRGVSPPLHQRQWSLAL
mmetsp:Transcript_33901/g.76762  ORF Transcript_33901/g.76762 Transcript_33901/m.76762 type:complete len:82 (-) Transcript_33901:522-767(-)